MYDAGIYSSVRMYSAATTKRNVLAAHTYKACGLFSLCVPGICVVERSNMWAWFVILATEDDSQLA